MNNSIKSKKNQKQEKSFFRVIEYHADGFNNVEDDYVIKENNIDEAVQTVKDNLRDDVKENIDELWQHEDEVILSYTLSIEDYASNEGLTVKQYLKSLGYKDEDEFYNDNEAQVISWTITKIDKDEAKNSFSRKLFDEDD